MKKKREEARKIEGYDIINTSLYSYKRIEGWIYKSTSYTKRYENFSSLTWDDPFGDKTEWSGEDDYFFLKFPKDATISEIIKGFSMIRKRMESSKKGELFNTGVMNSVNDQWNKPHKLFHPIEGMYSPNDFTDRLNRSQREKLRRKRISKNSPEKRKRLKQKVTKKIWLSIRKQWIYLKDEYPNPNIRKEHIYTWYDRLPRIEKNHDNPILTPDTLMRYGQSKKYPN